MQVTQYNFNSRPCVRGDGCLVRTGTIKDNFNSRPCVRGDVCSCGVVTLIRHFNSRPCVRGDIDELLVGQQSGISIHAPV